MPYMTEQQKKSLDNGFELAMEGGLFSDGSPAAAKVSELVSGFSREGHVPAPLVDYVKQNAMSNSPVAAKAVVDLYENDVLAAETYFGADFVKHSRNFLNTSMASGTGVKAPFGSTGEAERTFQYWKGSSMNSDIERSAKRLGITKKIGGVANPQYEQFSDLFEKMALATFQSGQDIESGVSMAELQMSTNYGKSKLSNDHLAFMPVEKSVSRLFGEDMDEATMNEILIGDTISRYINGSTATGEVIGGNYTAHFIVGTDDISASLYGKGGGDIRKHLRGFTDEVREGRAPSAMGTALRRLPENSLLMAPMGLSKRFAARGGEMSKVRSAPDFVEAMFGPGAAGDKREYDNLYVSSAEASGAMKMISDVLDGNLFFKTVGTDLAEDRSTVIPTYELWYDSGIAELPFMVEYRGDQGAVRSPDRIQFRLNDHLGIKRARATKERLSEFKGDNSIWQKASSVRGAMSEKLNEKTVVTDDWFQDVMGIEAGDVPEGFLEDVSGFSHDKYRLSGAWADLYILNSSRKHTMPKDEFFPMNMEQYANWRALNAELGKNGHATVSETEIRFTEDNKPQIGRSRYGEAKE